MIKLFRFLLIFVFVFPLIGDEIEFSASVDAETIGLNDYLIYTVTFKGIQNPSHPDVESIADFRIVQTSRSSEFKFINGVSSTYVNFVYYLAPLKEGILIIPPLKYVHNNHVYKTESIKIVAVKGSVKKVAPKRKRRSIFDSDFPSYEPFRSAPREINIKTVARINKRRVRQGEQLIYKVLLYSTNRIESVNLVSGQSFPGFWQEWYPVKKSIDGRQEIIDGKKYVVFEIRKAALFPTKSGKLKIPSLKFELFMRDGSFSFFSTPEKITRVTNPIIIDVLDNSNGNLPIGRFKITVDVENNSIDINELLSVNIKVRGSGNIKTLKIPEFESSDRFKIFPSKISRKIYYTDNGIKGYVSAEVPVSFNEKGTVTLPALKFEYFDPVESKTKTTESKKIEVFVSGVKEISDSNVNNRIGTILKKGSDINFIKTGTIYDQKIFIYQTVIFRVFLFLIIIGIVAFLIYEYFVKRFILGNEKIIRKRVVQNLLNRLDNVKGFAEIFQIIEEYIERKTGISRSEINVVKIENIFYSSGVSKVDTKEFLRIRQESEQSRFSGSTIKTPLQLEREISELKRIIKRIDSKLK